MCTCVSRGQKTPSGVIPQVQSTWFLRQGLALALSSPGRIGWLSCKLMDQPVSAFSGLGLEASNLTPDFFTWVLGWNFVLHTCIINNSLLELFLPSPPVRCLYMAHICVKVFKWVATFKIWVCSLLTCHIWELWELQMGQGSGAPSMRGTLSPFAILLSISCSLGLPVWLGIPSGDSSCSCCWHSEALSILLPTT